MSHRETDGPVRINWTDKIIRDLLVAKVRRLHAAKIGSAGKLANLKGLADVPVKSEVQHSRRHTIFLSRANIRMGDEGDCLGCAWSRAADETPGIFASLIQRRVARTLERDKKGRFRVYTYGVPDMARYGAMKQDDPKFDRRKLNEASITFRALPYSRTKAGVKAGRGTGTPRGRPDGRKVNPFSNLRMSVQADFLRDIGYTDAAAA